MVLEYALHDLKSSECLRLSWRIPSEEPKTTEEYHCCHSEYATGNEGVIEGTNAAAVNKPHTVERDVWILWLPW